MPIRSELFSKIFDLNRYSREKTALIYYEKQMTYEDLFHAANKVANFLKCQRIGKNSIVSIISKRSFDLIASVLGVIQAGAAYHLIDPSFVKYNISTLIEQANPCAVLVDDVDNNYTQRNNVVPLTSIFNKEYPDIIKCNREPDSLTYIVFTSGTSGMPKAVFAEDQNITAYIDAYLSFFNFSEQDIMLQQSPIFYDGFAEELLVTLFNKGKLVLVDNEMLNNSRRLSKIIREYTVTWLPTTPLMLKALNNTDPMPTIRAFISSGDILRPSYYQNLLSYSQVYNMYGSTETTVCSTCYKCTLNDKDPTPIGKPLENYNIQIVGPTGLSGIGEVGEICLSGDGITRIYKQMILSGDNISSDNSFPQLFHSGDYAYWDEDGILNFVGRMDRQIKRHGHRIHLSEVEKMVCSSEEINEAAVIFRPETDQICLFYTSDEFNNDYIRQVCKENISEIMRPDIFCRVPQIIISKTGKIDYDALLACLSKTQPIVEDGFNDEYSLQIFTAILSVMEGKYSDIEKITLRSRFDELGFDSISFLKVVVHLEQIFNIEFEDEFISTKTLTTGDEVYNYVKSRISNNT
ncbi:hypothetical protein FACS1894105_06930 [Clostridia bacterium]|nr:hypothetical protein FACS1894105_06930 [Clostridia bacterium]